MRATEEPPIVRVVGWYILALGAFLLAQGDGSLIRRILSLDAGWLINGAFNADPRHATIHVVWGLIMVTTALFWRSAQRITQLALAFGVFYVGLAILGIAVHDPFGMQLGVLENGFHWTVGPLTLALGVIATRGLSPRHAPAHP